MPISHLLARTGRFCLSCHNASIGLGAFLMMFSSCKTRQFEQAKVQKTDNIRQMNQKRDGTFTVICKDDTRHDSVTSSQIDNQEVCSEGSSTNAIHINPMAFNAFYIWTGRDTEQVLSYPTNWQGLNPKGNDDGVFLVKHGFFNESDKSEKKSKFVAKPTVGARVIDDTLVYPATNGKKLLLKFFRPSSQEMILREGARLCDEDEMRLPTARELFDFCAAGVEGPDYGPNFRGVGYPKSGRCPYRYWSATWERANDSEAEWFSKKSDEWGNVGYVYAVDGWHGGALLPQLEKSKAYVWCVGRVGKSKRF